MSAAEIVYLALGRGERKISGSNAFTIDAPDVTYPLDEGRPGGGFPDEAETLSSQEQVRRYSRTVAKGHELIHFANVGAPAAAWIGGFRKRPRYSVLNTLLC